MTLDSRKMTHFRLGPAIFSGALAVCFSEGNFHQDSLGVGDVLLVDPVVSPTTSS